MSDLDRQVAERLGWQQTSESCWWNELLNEARYGVSAPPYTTDPALRGPLLEREAYYVSPDNHIPTAFLVRVLEMVRSGAPWGEAVCRAFLEIPND